MTTPSASCTALVVYSGDDKGTTIPSSPHKGNQRFVGLSNQGATCYMNSLLQTLYMTPEFRTALYKWKYNPEKDGQESHCIPLQLQKLFGLLQLSNTRSVDTIALTKSFGWEGSEVFQQQDVQELCRVLFDALEESFKGTEVEKAIDEIYAGEMVDYVKCIDIDYQSERRDKFLDCSLAIRPYGSTKSMKSLTECLEHYLEPEILDGDNKYYAESVERKVDAIKGLKFSRLPPVLSVQLKRFVYDFSGDSIIQMKINDEVKFPLILDLNKYVSRCKKMSSSTISETGTAASGEEGSAESQEAALVIDEFEEFLQKKIKELRAKKSEGTTDHMNPPAHTSTPPTRGADGKKGTDWNSGKGSPASLVCEDDHLESKDDLDVPDLVDYNGNLHPDLVKAKQTAPVGTIAPPRSDEIEVDPEKMDSLLENVNLKELVEQRGEWIYELYAVLVHSGAISGGHYYVYIKDIETNKWWNFNDSYVDEITVAKVLQASGGMVQHTSYYGVKSEMLSSANAYMLMYRKLSISHPTSHFPPNEMVPEYIKDEIQKLAELAEKKRKEDEERFNRLSLQIYWQSKSHLVTSHRHASYKSLLQQIWTELDIFNSPEYQAILAKNREIELLKEKDSLALADSESVEGAPSNEANLSLPVDPLVVPLDEIRLRIFYAYNKVKQDPFPVETRGNMSLEAIRMTTYRDLIVELRSKYEEWEGYEPDGFNLLLFEYDSVKDDFKSSVTIRLPRNSTLKDLKNRIGNNPMTKHIDLSKMRILKLVLWSLADVKIDEITSTHPDADSYRLILDLRLCEGQKIYLETNDVPLESSPSVRCYTAQINRITVLVNKPGVVDEPERSIAVDRRATLQEFRELIAKEFDIEPDSFRVYRKTALDSELSGDKAQSLYALGIYNGIALHLAQGKPLLPGHYLLKLFLYKPPGRSALHDLQSIELPSAPVDKEAPKETSPPSPIPEVDETPLVVEVSATVVEPSDCLGVVTGDSNDNGNVVMADNVAPVPDTSSHDTTPLSVATGTPVSLNEIDIDVLTNGTVGKSVAPGVVDPFKIDDDTPETSSSDILGFGYKMIELLPNNDQFEFITDFDVEADTKISQIKQEIFDYLLKEGKVTAEINANYLRLRLKSKNTISTIFSHNLSLRENQIHLFSGREVGLEILDHEEIHTALPNGDVVVYVQKWNRKTWTLEKPLEVILRGGMLVSEISQRLAILTNTPPEGFRVLLLQPYNEVKLCDLYLKQPSGPRPWINTMVETKKLSEMHWYLRDWDTLLVQDSNEPLKKLSKVEIQTVKEARAYQSNYGYDYYYDGTYVTPTTASVSVGNTSTQTSAETTKRPPARVERGIQIKTHKDREKERQQRENEQSGDGSQEEQQQSQDGAVEVVATPSSGNNYVLFSEIE